MKTFNKSIQVVSILAIVFFAGLSILFLTKLSVFKLGTALFCLAASAFLYWHVTKTIKGNNSPSLQNA